MKNKLLIWIIVGIILIGIISMWVYFGFVKSSEKPFGINVHYYKDGVEVFPQSVLQSVVTPPGIEIDQISFDIIGSNTGETNLNVQIIDASPQPFKDALPTTTKILDVEETKTLWQSGLIDVLQFESYEQPVKFWINISGKAENLEEEIFVEHSVDLTFAKEYVSGGWNIDKLLDLTYSPESLRF